MKRFVAIALLIVLFAFTGTASAKVRPKYKNWTATENIKASGQIVSQPAAAAAFTPANTAVPNATVLAPCDASAALPIGVETPIAAISSIDADAGDTQTWQEIAIGLVNITPFTVNGPIIGCPMVHVFGYTGAPTGCTDFASCSPLMTKRVLFVGPVCSQPVQTVNFLLPQIGIPPTGTAQTFISVTVDADAENDVETCNGSSFFSVEHNSLGVTLIP